MYPSLETVQSYVGKGFRRVPVYKELLSDCFTPVEVIRTLRSSSSHCFLLESAEQGGQWGRYSFLGCNPKLEITCTDKELRIRETNGDCETTIKTCTTNHPEEALRQALNKHKSPVIEGMPPLAGGLVGYFSYEYFKYSEPSLQTDHLLENDFCDVDLMLFDELIVFDHYQQKIKIIAGVDLNNKGGIEAAYEQASQKIASLISLLKSGARYYFPPLKLNEEVTPRFNKEQFTHMVETARNYIYEGDIFQVVLSNPLTAKAQGSLFDTYRLLRTSNPSPYMFYFTSNNVEIAGASPETLTSLNNGELRTFPLAGTRPRGLTANEDVQLEAELLCDEKELSEHNMLVDLGRNDLGRVSEIGSVEVEDYLTIHRYSHVMHIGSTVKSTLAHDKDSLDAIGSILPAGTLSGAPKLRACEIIKELEGTKRGIYGGAIGYLDFSGNMDTCIAIRLAYKKNGTVCVQSGAGIVADSNAEKEYEECQNKARAVVQALKESEGGIL